MATMAGSFKQIVSAAALATALASAPAAAETEVLGTLELGDTAAGVFIPGPGSFSDILTFTLGSGVTGVVASAVSLNLAPFFSVTDFTGTLYSGTSTDDPADVVSGAPTLTDANTPFDYSLSSGTYSFLFEGNATGTAGGAYAAAVAAVPEPGQVALLLAGLGMLGWMARRRSHGTGPH